MLNPSDINRTASFEKLGVYEEVPGEHATSIPLPARVILVTKPNTHGGQARKKARIISCGNFQEVHPDEFTASGFLCARLFGERDADLGGNEIFTRPPKILDSW